MTSSMVMMPTGGAPCSRVNAAVPEMLRCDACKAWPSSLGPTEQAGKQAVDGGGGGKGEAGGGGGHV